MNKRGQSEDIAVICTTVFFIIVFGLILYTVFFYSPSSFSKTDENELTSRYIKQWYPEYTNCTIEYGEVNCDFSCEMGALVYCDNQPNNRDHLRLQRGEPSKKIAFEGITIEDIRTYYSLQGWKK